MDRRSFLGTVVAGLAGLAVGNALAEEDVTYGYVGFSSNVRGSSALDWAKEFINKSKAGETHRFSIRSEMGAPSKKNGWSTAYVRVKVKGKPKLVISPKPGHASYSYFEGTYVFADALGDHPNACVALEYIQG